MYSGSRISGRQKFYQYQIMFNYKWVLSILVDFDRFCWLLKIISDFLYRYQINYGRFCRSLTICIQLSVDIVQFQIPLWYIHSTLVKYPTVKYSGACKLDSFSLENNVYQVELNAWILHEFCMNLHDFAWFTPSLNCLNPPSKLYLTAL